MEDNQREAMFNAWKNSKITLTPTVVKEGESCTVSVEYEGKEYSVTRDQSQMFGTANPYNIAFNALLSEMKGINKDIELKYVVQYE